MLNRLMPNKIVAILFFLTLSASTFSGLLNISFLAKAILSSFPFLAVLLILFERYLSKIWIIYIFLWSAFIIFSMYSNYLNGQSMTNDFVNQVILLSISTFFYISYRQIGIKFFARISMLLSMLFICIVAMLVLSRYGLSLNYEALRSIKFEFANYYNLHFNVLGFVVSLLFLVSLTEVKVKKFILVLYFTTFILFQILIGSRTSLATILFSVGVVFAIRFSLSRKKINFSINLGSLPIYIGLLFFAYQLIKNNLRILADLTTGRIELWLTGINVGINNFPFGTGVNTWREYLIPNIILLSSDIRRFEIIEGGSYHSSLIVVFSERGIVPLIASLGIIFFLSVRVFNLLKFEDRLNFSIINKPITIFSCILVALLIRGLFENGGIFGYGNSAADYLSHAVLGLILGYISVDGGKNERF